MRLGRNDLPSDDFGLLWKVLALRQITISHFALRLTRRASELLLAVRVLDLGHVLHRVVCEYRIRLLAGSKILSRILVRHEATTVR